MIKKPLLEPEPENEWEEIQPEQVLSEEKNQNENDGEYIASRQEVYDALKSAYQKDKNLQIKLLGYIQSKIYERTGNASINAKNSNDFLSLSLEKILNGTRKWKKNKVPNIVHLLIMASISEIRHETDKLLKNEKQDNSDFLIQHDFKPDSGSEKKRKRYKPNIVPLFDIDSEGKEKENSIADEFEAKNNFAKYKELYDETEDQEELISVFEKELSDDANAYCVFDERLKGKRSNKEIAAILGITVREVENTLKKIKRLYFKLLNRRRL